MARIRRDPLAAIATTAMEKSPSPTTARAWGGGSPCCFHTGGGGGWWTAQTRLSDARHATC